MNCKEFLKPNWKKIVLFIVLFLLIPFPLLFLYTSPPFFLDLSSAFLPLTAPLVFIFAIFSFIEWLGQDGFSALEIVIYVVIPLLYPFILYLISCWVATFKGKKKKSEDHPK